MKLQILRIVIQPAVVDTGVLLEVNWLPIQRIQVLVVVDQVVPELVTLGSLACQSLALFCVNQSELSIYRRLKACPGS